MTKKHFIALADKIKAHNATSRTPFTQDQLDTLAGFCMDENPHFNYSRWLDYIEGKCGPNGGKLPQKGAHPIEEWFDAHRK